MRRAADPGTEFENICATMGASYQIGARPERPACAAPAGPAESAPLAFIIGPAFGLTRWRGRAFCPKML
jgi:hypothetical protein